MVPKCEILQNMHLDVIFFMLYACVSTYIAFTKQLDLNTAYLFEKEKAGERVKAILTNLGHHQSLHLEWLT